jgi:3-oxoadipate enol-lactonase
MSLIWMDDLRINVAVEGPRQAPPLVLLHALGTDLTLWDGLIPHLPACRVLRIDLRGHGASDVPPPPYTMGSLIRDVERAMDHACMTDAAVLGLSIGGLIAQGLAVKRRDLVRVLILSNTAARIGTPALWADRIAAVRAGGMAAIAAATVQRWFGPGDHAPWVARLATQDPQGWIGCAQAIAGADFRATTPALRLPALAIAGDRDASTPPDLVRDTAALIGGRFALIRGAGHLPFIEQPAAYAAAITGFLHETGHLAAGPLST